MNCSYDIIFNDATYCRVGGPMGIFYVKTFSNVLMHTDSFWSTSKLLILLLPKSVRTCLNLPPEPQTLNWTYLEIIRGIPPAIPLTFPSYLPSGARTGLDWTWTSGLVQAFEVQTKVLDWTLASLVGGWDTSAELAKPFLCGCFMSQLWQQCSHHGYQYGKCWLSSSLRRTIPTK